MTLERLDTKGKWVQRRKCFQEIRGVEVREKIQDSRYHVKEKYCIKVAIFVEESWLERGCKALKYCGIGMHVYVSKLLL